MLIITEDDMGSKRVDRPPLILSGKRKTKVPRRFTDDAYIKGNANGDDDYNPSNDDGAPTLKRMRESSCALSCVLVAPYLYDREDGSSKRIRRLPKRLEEGAEFEYNSSCNLSAHRL